MAMPAPKNVIARMSAVIFFIAALLPVRTRSLLPVLGREELDDLGRVGVGDPVRPLPLHLLDEVRPLLLGLGASGGAVEGVAHAALLLEERRPFGGRGGRGGRRRGCGLWLLLLAASEHE